MWSYSEICRDILHGYGSEYKQKKILLEESQMFPERETRERLNMVANLLWFRLTQHQEVIEDMQK